MATDLEQYIRNNRGEFDQPEPDEGHVQRFEKRLSREFSPRRMFLRKYSTAYRVAAGLILLIGLSIGLRYAAEYPLAELVETKLVESNLPIEVLEVMNYYSSLSESKLDEIDRYVSSPEEAKRIKEMATQQIQLLEINSQELIQEMNQSGHDDRLQNAILNNQKLKKEVLDNIIEQLKSKNF